MPALSLDRRQFVQSCAALAGTTLAGTGLAQATDANKPRKVVMVAGTPSHGPGAHEFNAGVQLLAKCLATTPGLKVDVQLNGYPKDESVFDGASAIVCYADGGGGHPFCQGDRLKKLGAMLAKGVGFMCMHYGVEVQKDKGGPEFQQWIGGYYENGWSCNPMWSPEFKEFPQHPITRGVKPFSVQDEWYFNMRFRPEMQGVTPILVAKPSDQVRNGPYVYPKGPYAHIQEAKGQPETMMWAVEREDGGRGVGFTGGHFHQNWADDNFRKVVLNGILWVSQIEVPEAGVEQPLAADDIKQNLDPKGKK